MKRAQPWHRYWTALLLVLALALSPGCISQKQWENTRAHLFATTFAALLGGLAAVITGGTGLLVFTGGVLGGTVIDQALEPEPEVHHEKTTTVVQLAPPAPDGTPQKPRVDTYTTKADGSTSHDGARGDLKLPDPARLLRDLPPQLTGWEKFKGALVEVVWAVVILALLVAALSNDKLRGRIFGVLGWLLGAIGRGAAKGAQAAGKKLRELRKQPHPPSDPR